MKQQPNLDFIRKNILPLFPFEGELETLKLYGSGHINDTYAAIFRLPDGTQKRYTVQRINTQVFRDPDGLMKNIVGVTSFLRKKIEQSGGNPERETLTALLTRDNKEYYQDMEGGCWRVYFYIRDSFSVDRAESVEEFYEAARTFGKFQMQLADYPAETLCETIPKFHDTVNRLQNLKNAIAADPMGRVKDVQAEINFALEREADTHVLLDLLHEGKLPLRVTHNDTKISNILLDSNTKQGICVIDLDTVLPGLVHYDFGDAIRFGASTAAEDEQDLSKVSMDLDLFEAYTRGFLEMVGSALSPMEKETLHWGAKLMTLECGMRFLTDYLEGDSYFKIHRDGQNLDRARTQFKLVADMEQKWDQMQEIIKRFS